MSFFGKFHPYGRSEREIASKHTAQHRAISSAQVAPGIIQSLVAPNDGPLSASFISCCILSRASEAGGVTRPRSGALAIHTKYRQDFQPKKESSKCLDARWQKQPPGACHFPLHTESQRLARLGGEKVAVGVKMSTAKSSVKASKKSAIVHRGHFAHQVPPCVFPCLIAIIYYFIYIVFKFN